MSGPTLKRKRSLKDSIFDLSRVRMALNRLDALKEELDMIEETEEAVRAALEHVHKLEDTLKGAEKLKVSFSTVSSEDLEKAGVKGERLVFTAAKITDLTNGLTMDAEAHIVDLHTRINEIYACVNMDYEPGSRMILDAILLALRKITSTQEMDVAILPGMRITHGDGVQISHPTSGYELWLSGNVDCAVIGYEKDIDMDNHYRLLGPGGSRRHAFKIASSCLFLVEAKRQSNEQGLSTYIPEAVSQAIALLKIANLPEVRFCLSDGQTWIFFILKSENNTLTYYESGIRRLDREKLMNTDLPLREIMQLIREWLKPTVTDLFKLK